MILLRRISPFVAPVLLFITFSGILLRPAEWIWWLVASIVVGIGAIVYMFGNLRDGNMWGALLPILLFVGGGVGMLIFVNVPWHKWALALFITVGFALYIENLFTFRYQPQKYSNLSLPNVSWYVSLIGTFFVTSLLFALDLISVVHRLSVVLGLFVISLLLITNTLRWYKSLTREQWPLILAWSIVVAEIGWALVLLPTIFIVNGAVATVLIYGTLSLVIMKIRDVVDRSVVIRYSTFTFLALLAILASSQWS